MPVLFLFCITNHTNTDEDFGHWVCCLTHFCVNKIDKKIFQTLIGNEWTHHASNYICLVLLANSTCRGSKTALPFSPARHTDGVVVFSIAVQLQPAISPLSKNVIRFHELSTEAMQRISQ